MTLLNLEGEHLPHTAEEQFYAWAERISQTYGVDVRIAEQCALDYSEFTATAVADSARLTEALENLEQALDCTLFSRTSRSVQLTPEGEELFSHIAPAIQQIKDGEETVLLHSKLKGGTISIGVSEIALHQVLLPVLERFRQEYPGIRLRIFNSNTQQAVLALKNRLVDFSLVTPPIEGSDVFLRRDVAAFREVPVCGKAYQYLADQPLTWEHLDSLPIINGDNRLEDIFKAILASLE
jgi:DNA-binding transcriptional LysR family regulator